jgi:predicted CoA-binding protein
VVPVNPQVQEAAPPVEAALLMTPPRVTETVVRDCAAAGARRGWMHQGGGVGAVSAKAVSFCQEHAIEVVASWCPYMFLPQASWFHRLQGWLRRARA